MSLLQKTQLMNSTSLLPSYQDWFPLQPKPEKLLKCVTVDICDTFRKRNPFFKHDAINNPKRVLTKPSEPCNNDGYDNENYDYILYVHGILGERYQIIDVLGSGTFGQVAKCKNLLTDELVGVKVIKNKPAYTKQSLIEVDILTHLNTISDPDDKHHILRLKESFFHKSHLCLVFELLSVNLYELIKQNHFKGLSTNLVRIFSTQILDTLIVTKASQIIHCDLKPENILLKSLDSPTIKVIDFGSACHESQQTYTYIQSRFYRSPEVLLGLRYTTAIDMWSFGCIVAELYLGLPIFPGSSEYNQLTRIIEAVGNIPDYMIVSGKHGHRYFNRSRSDLASEFHYTLKDIKQYSQERKKSEKPSKRYFSTFKLDELILKYPMPRNKNLTGLEEEKEMKTRHHLLDFLKKVLTIDPQKRMTPQEAAKHPFISGIEQQEQIRLDEIIKQEIDEEEEVPDMLTGIRRKSYADNESRSSTSVSPYTRKRYGSILTPLLSPPIENSQLEEQLEKINNKLRQRQTY
ncbi:hypothetical protein INT48_000963 [Thamnidium elegans]|uniref:Protein kinase domain-containing protein n=1 Tax=Thamnidium elegans TaxID=101142 RepID=A0A8H7SGH1_9FUNG|nr:hypothetical protein INT48_000963 [Thamnidium elegans]